ncbi:HDOD domain-containing protein [Undibacterium umbellatum]|uniref:HDOD domain-containing protein n=1 Tax=Undibacterium umbellatum TaxID=2762300 RepID=A0ABR6ZBP5_9BURK|nr:HDOD domain-containing protein [Undibacterium umbellatum]MBC3909183.1 HDOD domain-containing protein [Undibacterium umbellatum]
MNSKQQLLALQADFGALPVSEVIGILQFLQEKEIFAKLTGISVLIGVPDPVLVPADIDTRLPLARVLFSVPSRSTDDKDTQSRLKYFSSHGARVVIDDIETNAIWEGAKEISVDCSKDIPAHVKPLMIRLHGGNHIAQNLPNSALLAQADEAGFKWFSGDYAFNPPVHNKAADATARTRLLKLLGLVARDAESRELEELFKQDATLSFMLFKLVSSAAFAQTVRVSSFGQAINLLGRRQLQRWLQLLLYARQQDHHGGLNPLMPRAAFRASLMEAICLKRGGSKDELDCAFMVGMFSLLDKLFGNPLIEVLQPLNLNSEVLSALLQKIGALGKSLDLVEKADRPYKDFTPGLIEELGLSADDYYECVITAYAWVNQVCQDM